MSSTLKKFDPNAEYYFKEGCHIVELSNSKDDENLSIAQARVTPNTRTKLHALKNTTERYVVLEGCGKVEVGDAPPTEVHKGDVVIIPEQTPQRIFNHGKSDLIFLALCSPRFRAENYIELE